MAKHGRNGGWPNEPYRHGLSAKRVRSANQRDVSRYKVRGITLDKSSIFQKEFERDVYHFAFMLIKELSLATKTDIGVQEVPETSPWPLIRFFKGDVPLVARAKLDYGGGVHPSWHKKEIARITYPYAGNDIEIETNTEKRMRGIHNILKNRLKDSKWDKYNFEISIY